MITDLSIIRNAGGLASDDAIRSLVISQNLLGTEEVIVIEHTGCGIDRPVPQGPRAQAPMPVPSHGRR